MRAPERAVGERVDGPSRALFARARAEVGGRRLLGGLGRRNPAGGEGAGGRAAAEDPGEHRARVISMSENQRGGPAKSVTTGNGRLGIDGCADYGCID